MIIAKIAENVTTNFENYIKSGLKIIQDVKYSHKNVLSASLSKIIEVM